MLNMQNVGVTNGERYGMSYQLQLKNPIPWPMELDFLIAIDNSSSGRGFELEITESKFSWQSGRDLN